MQTNVLLKNTLIIGLCALTLVPLVVSSIFFFPYITGKNFAFRIGVEILFALWAILALKDTTVRPRPLAVLYAVGAFVLSLFVSAALGVNFEKSIWSNFERMEGWVGLLHLGLYFFLLSAMLKSEKVWKYFFNTSIVVSVLIGLYGIIQLAGILVINQGGVRVDSTLGNATYLAVYMLFHIFITAICYVRFAKNSFALKFWYIFAVLIQTFILYETATRGTILGLVAGAFLTAVILALFSKDKPRLRNYSIGVLVGVVLLIGGFFVIKDTALVHSSDTLQRLASISLSEGQTRFTIWGMAFQGFLERPVFGWGQENFNYVFNKYYEATLYNQEPWFDRAHNVVLDWLIAGGAVGFLLYVSVYVITLRYLLRPEPTFGLTERALLVGLIAGHAIHNFFVFDNLISYMFFLTVIAYVAYRSHESAPPAPSGSSVSSAVFGPAAACITILFFVVFYFVNVPGMVTASNVIEGIKQQADGATKNLEYFEKAAAAAHIGRQESREQFIQFALEVRRSKVGDEAFQNKAAGEAISAFQDEISKNPGDARLRLFLGSLYRQLGDGGHSLEELTKALELSPHKPTIMLELGVLYHDANDIPSAQGWFKKAFELEPRYDMTRVFYAVTAIEAHDEKLLSDLLMPRFGTLTPDNPYILQAYLSVNNVERVAGVLKEREIGRAHV